MTNGNGAPPEQAPPQQQPQINIQINVSANNTAENEYEVTLKVEGKAENAGKVMFSFDLAYAGVFRIVNVPKENLPPLMLDPVDFVGLYRQNMERQAAAQGAAAQAKPS